MKEGRPTKYTPKLAEEIFSQIIDGESLRDITENNDGMPHRTTILRWLVKHDEFRTQYAIAKELQAEGDLDDLVKIADDSSADFGFKEASDSSGASAKPIFLPEHVNRARLRIDTRLKRAEKMAPKKYGPLLKQEVSGPDGKPLEVKGIADGDLERRLTFLLGKIGTALAPGGERAPGQNPQAMDVLPESGAATP